MYKFGASNFSGVSMLRDAKQQSLRSEMHVPALEDRIREASVLHPYAVAAYTVSACYFFKFSPSKLRSVCQLLLLMNIVQGLVIVPFPYQVPVPLSSFWIILVIF